MDGDDYWNTSLNKSFSFDDDVEEKLVDDNVSEISTFSSSSVINLNLVISESDLQLILDDQMITEPIFPKVQELEEEVKFLRRKLQESQYSPFAITINKLLMGKPCSLSIYKSLKSKRELLELAISSGNGDAVIQVVLFLKATLKPVLFHHLLGTRPAAADHYLNFLNTTMKVGEATEVLILMGRQQEAALLQFKAAATSKNILQKLETLKKIPDIFTQNLCNQFLKLQVLNYISILELQINNRLYFQPFEILEKPVVESLYRCCEKFNKWSEPAFISATNPFRIVEDFLVAPAVFEWVALNERGKSQAWREIEGLFEKKSVLRKKYFEIHIPLELAIIRLYHLKAPEAILKQFLQHVEDPDRRLALSKKVGAIHSIVESLVALKDRSALEDFKESLASGTAEYFLAEKAIKNLSSTKSILGIRKSSNANNS